MNRDVPAKARVVESARTPDFSRDPPNKLDIDYIINDSRSRAAKHGGWMYDVCVAEAKNYETAFFAEGEFALVITDPQGFTSVFLSSTNVHAPSPATLADLCVPGARDLWDRRIKKQERKDAATIALRDAHNNQFSALERLGAVADD